MPTLIATPGADNANTYCSVADADAYHETVRTDEYSVWVGLSADIKNRSLVQATRLIDEHWSFIGHRTHSISGVTQKLEWPRKLVPIEGKRAQNGSIDAGLLGPMLHYLDHTTIPNVVKDATAELARQISQEDVTADSDDAGIAATSVGGLSVTFDKADKLQQGVMNTRLFSMLRKYGDYLPSLNTSMKVAGSMPLARS